MKKQIIQNIQALLASLFFVLYFSNCTIKKKVNYIGGYEFTSVKCYGAKGDGKDDDVQFIQSAFDYEENIFFPIGKYLIGSSYGGTHNPQSLIITNGSKVRRIVFEKGAELYIKEDFPFNGVKSSVIKIYTESGDIDKISITGLRIYAENIPYEKMHTGLFAIENNGYEIKKLEVGDASFYNLSGAGIITYAYKTILSNIYTENTSSHGIGALNPYNLGKEHYFYVDGYTSVNDKAYSIDFSGTEYEGNRSVADPKDKWTGVAKNIKSINSKRGIKTAGYWNLQLENVYILNPSIYGFFINKDAPGRKINFKNLTIENSGDAGLSLAGETGFEGDNLTLINCKMGAIIQKPHVNINRFIINGLGHAKMGLRFQSSGIISDFVVTGIEDEYAVWVTAKEGTLRNGKIYNNNSSCGLLIHEAPENITIDNVEIYNDRSDPKQKKDILILQKKGKLRILDSNIGVRNKGLKKLLIDNRSGIKIDKTY